MPKVLVIADAEWVRNDVRASFNSSSWEITESSEPGRVLDLIDEYRPDVVITDLQVANMGGMAVVRAITSELEPGERPATVLLLDRSADRFLARRAGADASIIKPFTAQDLRSALEALVMTAQSPGPGPKKTRPKK